MLKQSKIIEGAFLYCIIYLCTFDYWDTTFGMIFKYIFFGVVLCGIIGYYGRLLMKRGKIHTNSKNAICLYILCVLLFLFQAVGVENSVQRNLAFYQYVFFMIMIPGILFLLEYCEIKRILKGLKLTGIVLSIFAIYEVFSGKYLIQSSYLGIMYDGSRVLRAMVFSGSFLTFGTIMAMISVVSFYDYYVEKSKFNLICLVVNLVGLVMSSSRGPLVSFICSAIVVYVYIGGRANIKRVIKVLFIVLFAGALLITLGTILSKSNSTVAFYWDRFQSILDWTESSASNTSRISCWQYSIETFQQGTNWLFGIGPSATGARAKANWGGFVTESGLLKRFVELGTVVAVIYYAFFFGTVSSGLRKARRGNNAYIALVLGIVICILVEDTILQVTEELSVTFLLWTFICMLFKKETVEIKDSVIQVGELI